MKKIYTFKLEKEIETEEVQISTVEGKEVKTLVKVKKKEPYNYFVAKPGRSLTEDAELYYNSEFWKYVKAGIMPSSQLQKRYLDDDGVLSKDQKKEYNELYDKLFQKQAEHRALINKNEKSDEDKKESEKILNEIVEIMSTLQSFESQTGNQLYQNTAENLARNKCALWWTLMLSHQEKDGKDVPVFGAGDFEKKLVAYDAMEVKEDPFEFQLIQKLLLVTSLWYFGKAQSQEDFDLLLKVNENTELVEATKTLGIKEETKEPEVAPKSEEVKV